MRTIIQHRGAEYELPPDRDFQAFLDEVISAHGAWEPGVSRVLVGRLANIEAATPPPAIKVQTSTFEHQVTDEAAKVRIEAQHEALRQAGVTVDTSEQLYATGTRMADIGYATQASRKAEHDARMPVREAIDALIQTVNSERRRELIVSAQSLRDSVTVNGALSVGGFKFTEQAVRGLLARLDSPAQGYVFGLRDRIKNTHDTDDRNMLRDVVQRELSANGKAQLRLRVRDTNGDCFAVVSPTYGTADAPDVLPDVLAALPSDARASFSYDANSTAWELRAYVYTPTPVDEQAVGEPFEGYVSFQSRDNGTGRLTGGGGILIVRCLNASTYEAASNSTSRVHRGRILYNIALMAQSASKAIHALTTAWGTAREAVLTQPVTDNGKLIPLEVAIPGFFRSMLTARTSELVGVLPGRREDHVDKLAAIYPSERRNPSQLVRADLAQAYTRYVQDFPAPIQRDAERAIGAWMVKGSMPHYEAA